ncbi:MAG: aspartate aminotransferase family protein [Bacteroidales bacterium]|nr:aspartate aminotransferase family protein [Bacteroidota bacterium]MBL6949513.1 aspartate aminotransferase family protein [Bacteroidales bacterium]
MDTKDFREHAHQIVDWMADYLEQIGEYPVTPQISPGDIKKQLPGSAPLNSESFEEIFADFKSIILPGMTHWQHPGFFAYFPANNSEPSILAEMLTATMGSQCMLWLTSPAAEELEERMMEWLRDMLGLPSDFIGVIQDTASSSTLVAILTAREQRTEYEINRRGFTTLHRFRLYTSTQGHSSIDKDVKIAGIGIENLVKVEVDDTYAMVASALEAAIEKDIAAGYIPLCVVSTIGTTSSTAIDPIGEIGEICRKYNLWHHIDASYAGTALLLPEMRWMAEGVDMADSFVFNPHKWMFTNFDCSAYFVKDKQALISTFSILPDYLKTPEDKRVNNYRDWGIPLGRRFRALKLWFVIRTYGIKGLQEKIRDHIRFGQWLKEEIIRLEGVEIMAPAPLNLVCFRFNPGNLPSEEEIDLLNTEILDQVNRSGKVFLTQTTLDGKVVLRFVAAQTHTSFKDVQQGWDFIYHQGISLADRMPGW